MVSREATELRVFSVRDCRRYREPERRERYSQTNKANHGRYHTPAAVFPMLPRRTFKASSPPFPRLLSAVPDRTAAPACSDTASTCMAERTRPLCCRRDLYRAASTLASSAACTAAFALSFPAAAAPSSRGSPAAESEEEAVGKSEQQSSQDCNGQGTANVDVMETGGNRGTRLQ